MNDGMTRGRTVDKALTAAAAAVVTVNLRRMRATNDRSVFARLQIWMRSRPEV